VRRTSTRLGTTLALAIALALAAPVRGAPPAADDRAVPFGEGTAWLAVRGRTPQQLAKALKLSNLRPATWKDGLAAATADPEGHSRAVFLTPDVHGWTLVVSTGFSARVESRPPTFHTFTKELSKALDTEVQFFATADPNRGRYDACAWARAKEGTTLRAYSCFQTRQRAVDEGSAPRGDGVDVALARGELVGTPDVAGIAASWSVDPSETHPTLDPARRIPRAVPQGYLAELPAPAPERPAARPKLEPPDWAREAAANVTRPAAELEAVCQRGAARACADGALLLVADPGAKRSLTRAAELAARACEGGHAAGCTLRGWMLRRGVGVEEDRIGAQALFEQGCEGGHAPGCHLLGTSLQRGEGGLRRRSGAWDAYERACAGGHEPACAHTQGVGRRGGGATALPLRPACKGELVGSGDLAPAELTALLERVRKHEGLERDDTMLLARWQARLLRNAVFAARGRTFDARDLRAFFLGFDWYHAARKDVEALLSPEDRGNVALLQEQEACSVAGIADDAGDDDQGDWRLVEIFLAEADRPVPEVGQPLLGIWEPCLAVPDQGCPTLSFHPNGRAVLRAWGPARIGSWRVHGSTLRIRWFAEIKLVGAGFSPAEPGDENDEHPSDGVPKLFPSEKEDSSGGVGPFDRLDPQVEIPTATFGGSQWWKKGEDPGERR
jgi:TPR repeat protein